MIKFAEPGPDDNDDTEDMMGDDLDGSTVSDWEDQPDDYTDSEPSLSMVGPFTVRLNDVYDGEGRSVARCGYLHNTRASGPPMAESVCAALNRGYRKV